jgi:isoleucyl-tRNA synthetase
MSKSVGNVVAPEKVIKQYGAEILRLWVATQDYRNDTRVGDAILKQVSEAYRRIRNTARYILGNIHDFDPATDAVADKELLEIDRWALSRLEELVNRVLKSYDSYDFHVLYHAVHNFCSVDMSAFYLDVLKDRLYTSPTESPERRSAQTAMYRILEALTRMIAPVLSFTAEEIWSFMPGEREESIHLAEFPSFEDSLIDNALEEKYERILAVRSDVAKVLELARAEKIIGHSLDARVELAADGDLADLLKKESAQLASLLIVSQVEVTDSLANASTGENLPELKIRVVKARGEKCSRCWNYATTVGDYDDHPEICHRCLQALA